MIPAWSPDQRNMNDLQSEESDPLRSILRNSGDYQVLGLRLDRLHRQDCLDLFLVRNFEYHVLRFWSVRNLEIRRDDEAPRWTVLIDDGVDGELRVESPEGARSTIRFHARAVERFKRWPTAWDMYIDAAAGLCLWVWRVPFTHYGVMSEEVGLPARLARRLDRWIKSKYERSRSPHQLDTKGRELAPLMLPYLGPEVILHLYLEAEERYERINAPRELIDGKS
jgi:hypothetical protein